MTHILNQYNYAYHNSNSNHHHAYLITPLLKIVSQVTNFPKNSLSVLDIGCGNGSLTNLFAQQGYQVTGMEQSASGIEFANQSFPNCHFIHGSVYDQIPHNFKNNFDIVISAEVIEHLFYPRELARYARHCLKPGGFLIITTPYHGYWKNLLLSLTGKMDAHFTTLWDGGHVKFFSVKTLSSLLASEGFANLKFDFAGRIPYLWKSMLCCCQLSEIKE